MKRAPDQVGHRISHRAPHRCRKADIDWDRKVSEDFVSEDGLGWFGTCHECGRRVYEIYTQRGGLQDAQSGDNLSGC